MATIRRKNRLSSQRTKFGQSLLLVFLTLFFLTALWSLKGFESLQEEDPQLFSTKIKSDSPGMTVSDQEVDLTHSISSIIEDIQQAKLHLIDFQFYGFQDGTKNSQIVFHESELQGNTMTSKPPYIAKGTFCRLDWSKHKQDPASVPMFKDLVEHSLSCRRTTVHLDLHQAVSAARSFDERNDQNVSESSVSSKVQVMYPPKGIVFHESRCGSTLAANILAGFQPDQNRVYSESPPPVTAAKLFHPQYELQSIQLLQDVIYLMSRSDVPSEQHTFFKIQSIGVKKIHAFRKAFPDTPWIFLFRDPIQVLMSHLKKKGSTHAVCLRSRTKPEPDLLQLLQDHPNMSHIRPQDLSAEEFCALHLSTLCQNAIQEIKDSNGKGIAVNYKGMQQRLVDEIIPHHFLQGSKGEELSSSSKSRIDKIGGTYSKGREDIRKWKDDSQKKDEGAWPELESASEMFLLPWYEQLQTLSSDSFKKFHDLH